MSTPEPKPVYEVADVIDDALNAAGIEFDNVVGSDSAEYYIMHGGRKIRFFMTYDDEESES